MDLSYGFNLCVRRRAGDVEGKQAGNNMETRRENVGRTTFPHPVLGQASQGSSALPDPCPSSRPRSTVCWPVQGNRVAWPGEPWYLSGSVMMLRMNQATGSIRSYALSHSRHVREHPSLFLLLLSYFRRQKEEFHGSLCVASWGLGFAN